MMKQLKDKRDSKNQSVDQVSADAPDYARLHRILKIISLIQGQKGWNVKRLAAECGVTQRTIYRDLELLEGAGIPYFYDPQLKCYQIRRDFYMPPVELTLDEALAVVALGEHIGGQEQIPFTKPANRVVAKIRSQLPDRIRRELEGLDGHVAIKLAAAISPHGIDDVYELVRQAIQARRVLKCSYESIAGRNNHESFTFRPYVLFFQQRAWYVVGHHDKRKEVRTLKLNRFTDIVLTDEPFKVPARFSLGRHLGNAWRMIRGKKTYAVELRFDANFAETIADTHWHDTQEIEWHDDGSIAFTCKVDGLDEIVWWVLSMGPHCKVIKPEALVQRVLELSQAMVKLYGER